MTSTPKLATVRDITAIIKNVLLIIVLGAVLLFGWSALRAAGDAVNRDDSVKTLQECQQKPPTAVWPSCDRYK
jgi:hypothetical protein